MGTQALRDRATTAREMLDAGRRELTAVIRDAHRTGYTQRAIAEIVGCSQPEVNRLLRFHGKTPNGKAICAKRRAVINYLRAHGCTSPRVFGSTARGEDAPGSDIDLLARSAQPLGLLAQARIEAELSEMLGVKVDFVLESTLHPDFAEEILAEAVPL